MARSARAVEAGTLRALRRDVARARAALRARMVRLRAAAKRYRASARRRVRAWYQAELAKLRAERARRYAEIGLTVKRRAAELKERAALARATKRLDEHRRVEQRNARRRAHVTAHRRRSGRQRRAVRSRHAGEFSIVWHGPLLQIWRGGWKLLEAPIDRRRWQPKAPPKVNPNADADHPAWVRDARRVFARELDSFRAVPF